MICISDTRKQGYRITIQAKFVLFGFEGTSNSEMPLTIPVTSGEAPPVPIPNTEVKLSCIENTWRETAREDR